MKINTKRGNPLSDTELVLMLKQGSEPAFEQLFKTWHKKLYHFSLRYLNDREHAQEIVQDTLMNLWTSREKLEDEYPVGPYVYTICKRLCLNAIRDAARSKAAAEALWLRYEDISHSTEQALNLAELERFTEIAVQKLPKQQQIVFRMSRYEGLSHQEIAEILKISKETVKKHSAEALKTLRKHFESYGLLWLFFMHIHK